MSETTRERDQPRIFLVDDHPAMRQGLAMLLKQDGLQICGEAQNRSETMAQIDSVNPDLALLDVSLNTESGLDLIADFTARNIKVLCYSMLEDATAIRKAFDAGASGYVTKRETADNLLQAVREVLNGKRYTSPLAKQSLSDSASVDQNADFDLSGREAQIISLIGKGISNIEIAAMLHISVRTLEAYCMRVMAKLKIHGMREFRRYAIARQRGSEHAPQD